MENLYTPTIVLVDDEAELLELYVLRLKHLNCQFATFSRPEEFIAYLKKNSQFVPDLLVTDYNMPGMTGVQMVQAAQNLVGSFPTILLSGYLDKEKAIAATNSGVWHILEKPAEKEHFLALINKLILESRIRKLGSEIRLVMHQLTEMFTAFRFLCTDEMEIKTLQKPVVMPSANDPLGKPLSLGEALDMLEKKLQTLAEEENKISTALNIKKAA